MELPLLRLYQQRLAGDLLASPQEVVAWLGAVQAQDYAGAKWALGLRMPSMTDESIEQAFNAGAILRTHGLQRTWHFVLPADIRWMQALTAPRVHARNAAIYCQHELDSAVFKLSEKVISTALEGGRNLTRVELGQVLAEAGIQAGGQRRGKQFTYGLLAERAPQAREIAWDDALAALTRRYFTGHGPATVQDFTWGSGLTSADAKAGLDMAAPFLNSAKIGGQTYWFAAGVPLARESSRPAFLQPTYDKYLVGYRVWFNFSVKFPHPRPLQLDQHPVQTQNRGGE